MADFLDSEGVLYQATENFSGVWEWFFAEFCGLCGCCDEEIKKDIQTIFLAYDTKEAIYYDTLPCSGPHKYCELILHILDSADLLEHGSSIRGSWLTDKGLRVLNIIKENTRVGIF